jgi:hypothetical protein
MPFESQAPRTKKIRHKKKGRQLLVQDSINIDSRPSKKRKRDETGAEIVVIEDKNERKRRKKKDEARQCALKEDIQPIPIPPVQELGPTIIGTLEGEPKKATKRKDEDARTVEEPLAKVCLSKHSIKPVMSLIGKFQEIEPKKSKKKSKRKQTTSSQSAGELNVG